MNTPMTQLDIVIAAIERGETPMLVILNDSPHSEPATNSRYNGGCRCAQCRFAHAAYNVSWKKQRRQQVTP